MAAVTVPPALLEPMFTHGIILLELPADVIGVGAEVIAGIKIKSGQRFPVVTKTVPAEQSKPPQHNESQK